MTTVNGGVGQTTKHPVVIDSLDDVFLPEKIVEAISSISGFLWLEQLTGSPIDDFGFSDETLADPAKLVLFYMGISVSRNKHCRYFRGKIWNVHC